VRDSLIKKVEFMITKSNLSRALNPQNLWVKVRADINFLMIKKLSLEWSNISQVYLWEYKNTYSQNLWVKVILGIISLD
jgi:hypothetical protein